MLAGRFCPVVTCLARSHNRRMINPEDAPPAERGMAHPTLIVGLDV